MFTEGSKQKATFLFIYLFYINNLSFIICLFFNYLITIVLNYQLWITWVWCCLYKNHTSHHHVSTSFTMLSCFSFSALNGQKADISWIVLSGQKCENSTNWSCFDWIQLFHPSINKCKMLQICLVSIVAGGSCFNKTWHTAKSRCIRYSKLLSSDPLFCGHGTTRPQSEPGRTLCFRLKLERSNQREQTAIVCSTSVNLHT